jgi:16S rRNA G1207 methylase RsmC
MYGAEALAQSYLDDRESIKILDIAAGTGFLGEEVRINTIL